MYTNKKPIIEEIDSDDEPNYNNSSSSRTVPIYEDPDDEHHQHRKTHKSSSTRKSKHHGSVEADDGMMSPFGMSPFANDFFSSRSLFSSMMRDMERSFESMHTNMRSSPSSNNTVFYSSTTVTTSSNGVTETTKQVKDSKSGLERTTHARQIGDKYLAVDKVKDRQGRETVTKHLQNIREEEESAFDESWDREASNLPSWRSRFHMNDNNTTHHKAITKK